jgi:phosphotransferase system HPr-like phosphotransfer protein
VKIKERFVAGQDFGYRYISAFQRIVSSLPSYIYIGLDNGEDRLANAKSIIGVFSLQIGRGTDFTIIVMNDDENIAKSDMEIIKAWIRAN